MDFLINFVNDVVNVTFGRLLKFSFEKSLQLYQLTLSLLLPMNPSNFQSQLLELRVQKSMQLYSIAVLLNNTLIFIHGNWLKAEYLKNFVLICINIRNLTRFLQAEQRRKKNAMLLQNFLPAAKFHTVFNYLSLVSIFDKLAFELYDSLNHPLIKHNSFIMTLHLSNLRSMQADQIINSEIAIFDHNDGRTTVSWTCADVILDVCAPISVDSGLFLIVVYNSVRFNLRNGYKFLCQVFNYPHADVFVPSNVLIQVEQRNIILTGNVLVIVPILIYYQIALCNYSELCCRSNLNFVWLVLIFI